MKKIFFFLILFAMVTIPACKKEILLKRNKPPIAYAGIDITIILPNDSVELSGSGIDSDGTIISYNWSKLSGPSSFIIVNPNAAATKVKSLIEGIYEFELKVTDNGGLSGKDRLIVTVLPSGIDPCNGCWDY
jgi:hypothetical protein